MKRLETILPHLKPGEFDESALTYTLLPHRRQLYASPLALSFMKMCNGSYSVKEICLLVYARESSFSFVDIVNTLEKWAREGAFKNSEAVLEAILQTGDKTPPRIQPAKELTPEELLLALRKVSIFSKFSEKALKHIISVSTQQTFLKGENVVRKDTAAEEAFVLLTGSVGVFTTPYAQKAEPVAVLPQFNLFGESAAISNQKRSADVTALMPSQVLKIPVRKINDPELSGSLDKNLRLRLIFSQMIKTHPLFRNLPSDVIQLLLAGCRIEKSPAQTTVIQQGDMGQDFYFIMSGSVLVVKDRVPETSLSAGSYFGEMGGLLKQARSASILTETECMFLVLPIKNFIAILASNLNLAIDIERTVHERKDKPVADLVPPELTMTEDVTTEIRISLKEITDFDFSVDFSAPETVVDDDATKV